ARGSYPSAFQRFRTLYSWPAVRTIHRHNPIRCVLLNVRSCLQRGCRGFDGTGLRTSGTARWRVRLHYGNRRHVGRIFSATSSCEPKPFSTTPFAIESSFFFATLKFASDRGSRPRLQEFACRLFKRIT